MKLVSKVLCYVTLKQGLPREKILADSNELKCIWADGYATVVWSAVMASGHVERMNTENWIEKCRSLEIDGWGKIRPCNQHRTNIESTCAG